MASESYFNTPKCEICATDLHMHNAETWLGFTLCRVCWTRVNSTPELRFRLYELWREARAEFMVTTQAVLTEHALMTVVPPQSAAQVPAIRDLLDVANQVQTTLDVCVEALEPPGWGPKISWPRKWPKISWPRR